MRIAFDAKRAYHNATGLGNYSRNLIHALENAYPQHTYLLFTPGNPTVSFKPSLGKVIEPDQGFTPMWRSFGMVRQLVKHQADIYHGLSNEIPFTLGDIPSVVSIHDVIFKRYPNAYSWFDRQVFRQKTAYALRHAKLIFAASRATAADLIHFYKAEPNKIRILYPGIDDVYLQSEKHSGTAIASLPAEFILFAGVGNARKNLEVLFEAYQQLSATQRIPVCVTGGPSKYRISMEKKCAALGLQDYFYFVGNVTNNQMLYLYQKAQCLVFSSFYEGFGMPITEALACGCPVIAANNSSLPEAGGNACRYFNDNQPDELAAGLWEIITSDSLKTEMRHSGYRHLELFKPARLAEICMQGYSDTLSA